MRSKDTKTQIQKTQIKIVIPPQVQSVHSNPQCTEHFIKENWTTFFFSKFDAGSNIVHWLLNISLLWKAVEVGHRLWKSVKISENQWQSVKISENQWQSVQDSEKQWKVEKCSENQYKTVQDSEHEARQCRAVSERLWLLRSQHQPPQDRRGFKVKGLRRRNKAMQMNEREIENRN